MITKVKNRLKNLYKNFDISQSELKAEINLVLEFVTGLNQQELLLKDDLDEMLIQQAENVITKRVETEKPIQQILGEAYFMGDKFIVNEYTLIPRPETELLVRETIKIIKENSFKNILDIGTGTGCIACKIAQNTDDTTVIGVDISNEALRVALNNASKFNLFNRAIFRKSDLFSNIKEKFDIIVSNPPYIPPQDKNTLSKEVLKEPETALFTNDDKGIEFYEKIIIQSKNYLNKNGYILFELGQNQAELVKNLFEENNFEVTDILKDLSSIDRVIIAKIKAPIV